MFPVSQTILRVIILTTVVPYVLVQQMGPLM